MAAILKVLTSESEKQCGIATWQQICMICRILYARFWLLKSSINYLYFDITLCCCELNAYPHPDTQTVSGMKGNTDHLSWSVVSFWARCYHIST
jgi:hypothetical protein